MRPGGYSADGSAGAPLPKAPPGGTGETRLTYSLGARTWEVDAASARQMHLSLSNCQALALREIRRLTKVGDHSAIVAWRHVLRFCEEAGVKPEILR